MRLLRPQAEQGDAEAQYEVGAMYGENSTAVQRDYSEEVRFIKLAAAQDHPKALFWLAGLYSNGEDGLPKDVNEGWRLLKRSADKGDSDAQLCAERYEVEARKAADEFLRLEQGGRAPTV
jgi:uncharacterized protein